MAMIRLELTKAQKEQVREATGREVNVLELRLQGLPEPAEGQEGAPCVDNPAGQDMVDRQTAAKGEKNVSYAPRVAAVFAVTENHSRGD